VKNVISSLVGKKKHLYVYEDEKGMWSFQGQNTMYLVIFYARVKKFAQFLGITVNMLVKIVREKKSSKRGYTLKV
jgi:hypothetical protein